MSFPPRLRMRGVRKRFGSTAALDGVDLEVAPGEVLALLGQNGAGKSTLMKVLSGALPPDEGSLELDGVPYRPRSPLEGRRLGVSMVYQELSLAPRLSVAENLFLGLEPARFGILSRREMDRRAALALADLGHPDVDPGVRVSTLSPARRQVVEIARARVSGCRVLVLDEPTSSLALADQEALFAGVEHLRARGLAVVYISHFLEECRRVAARFTVLRDGTVAGAGRFDAFDDAALVDLMVGRRLDALYPRSARSPGEALLEVRGLPGEDLVLRRGEVLGIAGLMGSGRTELLRAIFGLDAPGAADIRLGARGGPASPERRWAQGAGFVSEDRKGEGLCLPLPVADNLTLTRLPPFGGARSREEAARPWIARLGVKCASPGQRVSELSGGNQQKAAFARLLHRGSEILLLDEPTRGIDVAAKADLYRELDALVAREGRSAILVSSYLPELLGVCDRIQVMRRGRLGPARPAAERSEHDLLREAMGREDVA